ncbi:hypothetical protein IMSAGC013_04501 [Lachnospiraceae bacterium]|nr:hypothetical protein IMSAGC013_04501 [Lachnospiraceae bacterium]
MKKRMIKSIPLEQGELYGIISGRRILLAKCNPRVEIMEHSTNVPILGAQSYQIKKRHIAIVLCPSPDAAREIDEAFLQTVTRFELSADMQRTDGIFENLIFDALTPREIDLDGDWIFETEEQSNAFKRLML